MPDLRFLINVSRPRFWLYLAGPYAVGAIAAVGTREQLLDWRILLFALYFLIPANLLVYGVNDIFDYETDKLNAKKSGYETLVTPDKRSVLTIVIVLLNVPFIVLASVSARSAIFALAVFLFLSIYYSAPPICAKSKPMLDSAFNVLYITPGIFAYQMISGNNPPIVLMIAAGAWTAAMHAFSAIPDISADSDAGLSTIATFLGSFKTHIFCLAAYIVAAVLAFQYLSYAAVALGIIYSALIIISLVSNDRAGAFRVYRIFPLVNAACGFVIFWYVAYFKFF